MWCQYSELSVLNDKLQRRDHIVTPISSFSFLFLFYLSASSNSFYFSIPSLLYQLKQKHTLKCWIKELPFIDFLSLLIKYSHEDVTLNAEEVATANKITIFSSFAITIKKYLSVCNLNILIWKYMYPINLKRNVN